MKQQKERVSTKLKKKSVIDIDPLRHEDSFGTDTSDSDENEDAERKH